MCRGCCRQYHGWLQRHPDGIRADRLWKDSYYDRCGFFHIQQCKAFSWEAGLVSITKKRFGKFDLFESSKLKNCCVLFPGPGDILLDSQQQGIMPRAIDQVTGCL